MQHLQPNTTLQGGKYRIERLLGQGGFGITYLAEQVSLGRRVAIKEFFMKDFCGRDERTKMVSAPTTGSNRLVDQYRKKFTKEARNLAKLNHPNIINVIDVFEENGTVYYAMPYLSGGSLDDYVRRHGALDESEAMKYVKQIARALKYMHEEHHLCHYDVKPANILLDNKGNAVLIDFGISKNYDASGHETSTTPIGLSEGFAPIEQYSQQVKEFSPESDVYSLGATLFFLVTGKNPPSSISRASGLELSFPVNTSLNVKSIISHTMKLSRTSRPSDFGYFFQNVNKPVAPKDYEIKTASKNDSDILKRISISAFVVLILILCGYYLWDGMFQRKVVIQDQSQNVKVITVKGVSFKMVKVDGGTFQMGATDEQESELKSSESPVHDVTLSDYYIGETQVTQALWKAVMGNNPSFFTGNTQNPVECVSWDNCQTFISKLNELSGLSFRLPTAAEWEFAARGGNNSKGYKYSGSNDISVVAWYWGNSSKQTHAVAKKAPNELGLYDMTGNVWEWCQDWNDDYLSSAQVNPVGPSSGSCREARGGCWGLPANVCYVARRWGGPPSYRNNFNGLRLALSFSPDVKRHYYNP